MIFFHIDDKNIHNGILFNALYSTIIFGFMFVGYDYIYISILLYLEKKLQT
jgi:hypothetical protein